MGAQAGKQLSKAEALGEVKILSAAQPGGKPGEYDVLVSVKPPAGKSRVPLDICCVVDISGSMCVEATLKNASGAQEGHGLSVLDVVRHAVGTVVASLLPGDRLSVVTFNLQAKLVFELANMDDAGKKRVAKVLETLDADAATNIWAGLETAVKHLKSKMSPDRYAAILLLTDGQPNEGPKEGEVAALRALKAQNEKALSGLTISTFGFGYEINSDLLRDLAIEGGGVYSFLPDSSFVGTTFVNSLANLLVTVARDVRLTLEPTNGAKIISPASDTAAFLTEKLPNEGLRVSICSMQMGQSKDFVVRMSVPDASTPFLKVTVADDHGRSLSHEVFKPAESPDVEIQRQRLFFIATVHEALAKMQRKEPVATVQAYVADALARMSASPAAKDKRLADLIEDMRGQVSEAFSRDDWFVKWGRHYLPSLLRAHLVQQCNNFKDPGVQHYGGEQFKALRDQIDEIFLKLPAPKRVVQFIPGVDVQPVMQRANMRVYHNSSAPCFDGSSMVLMADGCHRRVDSLKKGDLVRVPGGSSASVRCIIKTVCPDGSADIVSLPNSGLLVTSYHPVRIGGKWQFPCDIAPAQRRPCTAVYSFVLSSDHIMIINGTECVAMGHGFSEEVVRHPYFGSAAVLADLACMPGWETGCVEFSRGSVLRDVDTNLVVKMVHC